jgi:hypothetical protein
MPRRAGGDDRARSRAIVWRILKRPYQPQTNGKTERFIQTLTREWAYACCHPSSRHRNACLPFYLPDHKSRGPLRCP